MSRMRRMMIDPLNFGTQSGLPYESTGTTNQPHSDYYSQYTLDHSIRVWEPSRLSLSEPALFQTEPGFQGQTPDDAGAVGALVAPVSRGVTIHGIKGDIWLMMDGRVATAGGPFANPVGEWTDSASGAVVTVDDDVTYAVLGGTAGRSPQLMCPFFICMYRGTYKQIDSATGWEIDSGPADDPDTLLGLDTTSPDVLEEPRMDWWTRVDVPFPVAVQTAGTATNPVLAVKRQAVQHRVPMDLAANKRLGPNQVLWLHIRTGVIRAQVLDTSGNLRDALYRNHSFLCWNTMSALVSAH